MKKIDLKIITVFLLNEEIVGLKYSMRNNCMGTLRKYVIDKNVRLKQAFSCCCSVRELLSLASFTRVRSLVTSLLRSGPDASS